MICIVCHNGTTEKSKATITLNRNDSVIVMKDVPANICNNCGEYFLDSETAKMVEKKAKNVVKKELK